jgi:hypothetical protein
MLSLRSILLISVLSLNGPLHAGPVVDIGAFQVATYTNGFSRGFDLKVDMQIADSGQVTKAVMNIQQGTGKPTKKFGQDWIGVQVTGDTIIREEKMELRFLDLYDSKTKLLQHSIDLDDETVTSYRWMDPPQSMQAGQRLKVATVSEKDQTGKIILSGDVEFLLVKAVQGFEFCTIETTKNADTSEREITKTCEQFDSNRKITGVAFEVRLGSQSITTGTGKIRLK